MIKKFSAVRRVTANVLALSFCFSVGIVMTACEKKGYQEDTPQPSASKSVADMDEYLYFASGYNGLDTPATKEDNEVILKALYRIEILNENGLYRMNVSSAEEINVSPEVFVALEQIFIRSNQGRIVCEMT